MRGSQIVRMALGLALLSASCCCAARDMYTCNGPNGTKIFSETPCGKDAKTTEMRQLQTVGESPAVLDASKAAEQDRKDAQGNDDKAPASAPPPAVADSYKCVVPNGEVFYQHGACPPSVEVQTVSWVGNRPVTTTQYAPVQAVGISRGEACAAIRKPGNRLGSNRDQSYTLYERREHRDPCGK